MPAPYFARLVIAAQALSTAVRNSRVESSREFAHALMRAENQTSSRLRPTMLIVSKRSESVHPGAICVDVLGPSLAIELQHLEVPLHRRGIGQKQVLLSHA